MFFLEHGVRPSYGRTKVGNCKADVGVREDSRAMTKIEVGRAMG